MEGKPMTLNPDEEQDETNKHSLIEVKEELIISLSSECDVIPTLKKSHFLKPFHNPTFQPLPNPPLFTPSDPKIISNLTKLVSFYGRQWPNDKWTNWVDKLANTHQEIWKKVGIFDAIRASTYHINRDNELAVGLADKWCTETNTFIFNWGEVSVTLEDVLILGGFSVLGTCVLTPTHSKKVGEFEAILLSVCKEIRRNSGQLLYNAWIDHFKGIGGDLEHVALIAYWLSKFVFSRNYNYLVSTHVFVLAINLAFGTKFALAPAVLASIYRDLSLLKQKIVALASEGVYEGGEFVLWAPLQLVQLWAWERFPLLSPKPKSLVCGEPRLARWHYVKKLPNKDLRLNDEFTVDLFLWRPYVRFVKNWEFPEFYCDNEMWVLINSAADEELLSFARCLTACELVGLDCIEQYNPHRVAMQFGLDQDIPNFVPRLNEDFEFAWGSYNKSLDGCKFYVPPRLVEGDVTVQYSDWWKHVRAPLDDALIVYGRQRRVERIGVETSLELLVPCRSSKALDLGDDGMDISKERSSACEGVTSQSAEGVTIQFTEPEDAKSCEHVLSMVEYMDWEFIDTNTTLDGGSNHLEHCHSGIESSTPNSDVCRTRELMIGPTCEGILSQKALKVNSETERCEYVAAMKAGKGMESNESNMITGGQSNHSEHRHSGNHPSFAMNGDLNAKEPPLGPICVSMTSEVTVSVITSLIGLKDTMKCENVGALEEDKDKESKDTSMTGGDRSNHSEGSHSGSASLTPSTEALRTRGHQIRPVTENSDSVLAVGEGNEGSGGVDMNQANTRFDVAEERNQIKRFAEELIQVDDQINRIARVFAAYKGVKL